MDSCIYHMCFYLSSLIIKHKFHRSKFNIYSIVISENIKILFISYLCLRLAFEILVRIVFAVFVLRKPITVLFNVFYEVSHIFCVN